MHGWQSTVSALIEAGADINAQTKAGRTPLMSAVVSQSKNCVKLLLNEKSRINVDLVDQEVILTIILHLHYISFFNLITYKFLIHIIRVIQH